jgi:hypothetical protein
MISKIYINLVMGYSQVFCPGIRVFILILILISGFRRDVDENCALLGYYAASCGNCLPTFRDNESVPSSKAKSPSLQKSAVLIILILF